MPKLSDLRNTTEISLPSFPEIKVKLYTSLLVQDQMEARAKYPNFRTDQNQLALMGLDALTRAIIQWNVTEDDGETPLPITVDNLKRFPEADIEAMANAAGANKKKGAGIPEGEIESLGSSNGA